MRSVKYPELHQVLLRYFNHSNIFKSLLDLTVDNDERSRLMAVLNQSLYLRYAETEDDPLIQK